MTDSGTDQLGVDEAAREFDFGGLRFDVSFRGRGPTLRVLGQVGAEWTEMLRFDDFVDEPHFHAPPAERFSFDRSLGDPLTWFVAQVRDHLAEWLQRAGFGAILPDIDVAEITAHAGELEAAMARCVPAGCTRVTGYGLQRLGEDRSPAPGSR